MTNKKALALSLAFGCALAFIMSNVLPAHAGTVARSPKQHACVTYTTSVSTITLGPGALYSIYMSTGANSDFAVLYDSGSALGLSATFQNTLKLLPKIAYTGSATGVSLSSNTIINIDPPIEFYNGLMAVNSAATDELCVVYEQGRGLSGQ